MFGHSLSHDEPFSRGHKSITIKRASFSLVVQNRPKRDRRPARRKFPPLLQCFIALSRDYLATKGRMYLDWSAATWFRSRNAVPWDPDLRLNHAKFAQRSWEFTMVCKTWQLNIIKNIGDTKVYILLRKITVFCRANCSTHGHVLWITKPKGWYDRKGSQSARVNWPQHVILPMS